MKYNYRALVDTVKLKIQARGIGTTRGAYEERLQGYNAREVTFLVSVELSWSHK